MTTQTGIAQPRQPGFGWLDGFRVALVDLLFPPHCVACQRLGAWLCSECLTKIERISPPVCQGCGLPLTLSHSPKLGPHLCARCRSGPKYLDRLLAYAYHSGPLRAAIHQFKYEDLRCLASPLGRLMADGWSELVSGDSEAEIIVPIPLHPTRQRQRGYNQAALLGRELGLRLGCSVDEDTLIRTKATAPQVDLNVHERQDNVRNAFACRNDGLAGKQVMLVDDVCTTGATLEAAAAALQSIGARSVWAYTLARAKPGPHDVLTNTI